MSRADVVRLMGYKNTDKGLLRLRDVEDTDAFPGEQYVRRLFTVLGLGDEEVRWCRDWTESGNAARVRTFRPYVGLRTSAVTEEREDLPPYVLDQTYAVRYASMRAATNPSGHGAVLYWSPGLSATCLPDGRVLWSENPFQNPWNALLPFRPLYSLS